MSGTTTSPSPPQQSTAIVGRRPSRKNTLTQQQKNQKRQRATQDQLVTLEAEFNKNPTPTAIVRERIAQQINMTERSVQIWFQNRRAKIKLMAKKSIETGEECDLPESMRHYLAMQESGKGIPQNMLDARVGYGSALSPEPNPAKKLVIHHFQCRSLSIGSWRRIGQTTMDLVIFFCPDRACITYYINNDHAGYKIEYPFSYIKNIELETIDSPATANGVHQQGHIVVTLNRPPNFFMDSSGSGGFYQCMDFTEKQQASQVLTHYLGGHPKQLASQLAKLTTLEAYTNRHAQQIQQVPSPLGFYNPTFNISAPHSPQIVRPASSNAVNPPQNYHMEAPSGTNIHKHKRQRSRSVPIAVDFSAMGPMPSFSFQETNDSTLYAPAPQNQANGLRIDTSHPDFLDFRPAYPLSAATTTSPSDYASPNLLNQSLQGEINANAGFGSPYSLPWLSPLADGQTMIGSSVSPLSMDPNSSPQIATVRSSSADLYPMPHEDQVLADDGMMLSDLYSKQLSTEGALYDECEDVEFMQFPLSHQLAMTSEVGL